MCHLLQKLKYFVTEKKCVYSAVRSGALNVEVWSECLNGQYVVIFILPLIQTSAYYAQMFMAVFCPRHKEYTTRITLQQPTADTNSSACRSVYSNSDMALNVTIN